MKVEQLHGTNMKPFQVSELEYLLQDDSPDLPFLFLWLTKKRTGDRDLCAGKARHYGWHR